MELIIVAIVAALTAGVTEVGKAVVVDAYESLKTVLKKKYGEQSPVVKAVDELEADPDSKGRKMALAEKVEEVKANRDTDVLKAAQLLLDHIKSRPNGPQIIKNIQNVYGNYSAIAGPGGIATVNVNQPKE